MAKRHGETFEGNECVHYLDCGDGSMGVHKAKSYPVSHCNICILSYINYISIQLKLSDQSIQHPHLTEFHLSASTSLQQPLQWLYPRLGHYLELNLF